jgi:zinc finger protein 830
MMCKTDSAARQNNISSAATAKDVTEKEKTESIPVRAPGLTSESVKSVNSLEVETLKTAKHASGQPAADGSAAGKGPLPEGFFDNVDADYRARGLEPPKHDIQ